MQNDQWRRGITVAVVVSLILGLAGLGVGVEALRRSHTKAKPASVPATSIVYPASGSTVTGHQKVDAVAIGPNVTAVEFVATGGSLHNTKIGTGVASLGGWGFVWNTTAVPNGVYSVTSVSYNATGNSIASSSIDVQVTNY